MRATSHAISVAATVLMLAVLAVLVACGPQATDSEPGADVGSNSGPGRAPAWDLLVESYEPPLESLPFQVADEAHWRATIDAANGGEPWLVAELDAGAWTRTPLPDVWAAPSPIPISMSQLDADVFMETDGTRIERVSAEDRARIATADGPVFAIVGSEIVARFGPANGVPSRAVLGARAPLGRPDGPRWRVDAGRFTGDGFFVLPGLAESFTIAAGADRHLSFGAFTTLAATADDDLVLRIEQDGTEIWRRRVTADELTSTDTFANFRVDLSDAADPSTLRFSAEGPFAFCGFAAPVVGPRVDPALPGVAHDGRPNLVLFSADTFRADNLADQRTADATGPFAPAPALEALVDRSLRFANSWSGSTWTLPSHATMFTSLLPVQHGATEKNHRLARSARTLAEVLRDAGYRTVAVTDAVFVRSVFGLDQGFDLFDQVGSNAPAPLDRAREILATGDGRPTFLFVHTFFTHTPFVPSQDALDALGSDLDVIDVPRSIELIGRAQSDLRGATDPAWQPTAAFRELEERYRAQVHDFDTEFASWYARFDELGWPATTHLFFTSDHGESFGDHREWGHGGALWESQTRVPLLWSGPGVEPGVRADASSGIDLAPTMATLAGVPLPASWQGRDLALPDQGAVAWSSISWTRGTAASIRSLRHFALSDGRFKLHARQEEDDATFAFDLGNDPLELAPLRPGDVRWPSELAAAFASERARREAVVLPVRVLEHRSEGVLEQLEALGYR